jgi:SAM-dependent methyltransferase
VIRTLPRVVPAAPGKPARAEARDSQRTSLAIAEDPSVWSPELSRQTIRRYAELAPVWDGERGGYRPLPLADALERGGPWPGRGGVGGARLRQNPAPPALPRGGVGGARGHCAEVGCGTGLLTPLLARVWPEVVCLDLSPAMLSRSQAPWRVVADASRLPLPDGSAVAVVLADVPLFAEEVVRVLAPGGVVVWSNALGTDAPHHVPIPTVCAALERAARTPWSAVSAEAGWGVWAVLRRA